MTLLFAVLAVAALFVLWVRWTEPRMLYHPRRSLEATPAQLGWRFEDVRLTAEDGVKLHAWLIPANEDSGTVHPRLTVLLLHGTPSCRCGG